MVLFQQPFMMSWPSINRTVSGWTFEDSAFTSGWTIADGSKISTGSGTININYDTDGLYHTLYHDIGSAISDTTWLLRFKTVTSSITARTSATGRVGIGISSTTNNYDGTHDGIFFSWNLAPALTQFISAPDGLGMASENDGNFTAAPAATTRWWEIIRTSATGYSIKTYSDAYSTLIETKSGTIGASETTGLQYIIIAGSNATDATGELTATMDDVQFIDGSTTPP